MNNPRILFIHGAGDRRADSRWWQQWQQAVIPSILHHNPHVKPEFHALEYDQIFRQAPLAPAAVVESLCRLINNRVVTGQAR